ncbi:MAG: hypothetical protein J2P17_27415 [Mycobacterium sp.]|nr:hypothetical protein [Mycobacterium sp.]
MAERNAAQQAEQDSEATPSAPRASAGPNFSAWSPVIGVLALLAVASVRPIWLLTLVGIASVAAAWPFPRFRKVVPLSFSMIAAGYAAYGLLIVVVPPLVEAFSG